MANDMDNISESELYASLTLNLSSVQMSKTNYPNITFKAEYSPSSTDVLNSKGKEGTMLAQELHKELISVQLDLLAEGASSSSNSLTLKYGKLQLIVTSGGESVLKKLRDRFQDKVKVSANLSPKSSDAKRWLCAERMTINYEKHTCTRRFDTYWTTSSFPDGCRWKIRIKIYLPITCYFGNEHQTSQTILDQELHSDLVIRAENGAEVKAHKLFLSAVSPVLKATFGNKMKESLTGTLDMSDMAEKSVRAFLRCIYYQDLSGPMADVELAYDMFRAAHKYHVPILENLMMTRLEEARNEDFGVELAFKMYSFVKLWDSTSKLKAKAIRVLKLKWDEFTATEEYENLFKNRNLADEFFRDMAKF